MREGEASVTGVSGPHRLEVSLGEKAGDGELQASRLRKIVALADLHRGVGSGQIRKPAH